MSTGSTSTGRTGPPAPDGTATVRDGRTLLRFERRLRHPPERVWRALTDPGELSAWLAQATVLEPFPGGTFELRWLNAGTGDGNEDGTAVARGTITAFDPPRLLELDSDIHGRLRWELTPLTAPPDTTLLVFTSDLELPPEFLPQTLAGWHIHLDHLDEALDGARVDWPNWTTARWQVHHDRYAAGLGATRAVRALYQAILDGWNARDAQAFAAPFREDGVAVGFDGHVHLGRAAMAAGIGEIFDGHPTGTYVAKVRDVRVIGPGAAILRAVAGMVPHGRDDIEPEVNAVHTITAAQRLGRWQVALFQNTPARYHGRPDLADALTRELRQALAESQPEARESGGGG